MQKSSGHPYVCTAVFMLHPEFLPNFGLFVIGICKLNLAVLIKKDFGG